MKQFLLGLFLLPGLLGSVVIWHTLIDSKPDGIGGEITNRVSRAELVWLAMNKPHLFREFLPGLVSNIADRNKISERRLLHSKAFDLTYYLTNNPDVSKLLGDKPELVQQYWLTHLDSCNSGSADVSLPVVMDFLHEANVGFDEGCRKAAYLWLKYGKEWPPLHEK